MQTGKTEPLLVIIDENDDELGVMMRLVSMIAWFDNEQQQRVLRYLCARFPPAKDE